MAKNQQQQNNIKEQIFETVTTIVDESVKDLGYNITKICKITDDSEKEFHKYKVECGSLKMNVVDDNCTPGGYSNDQIVRVTIPNGNYNAKKVIEGLYQVGSEEKTIYVEPKNYFVPMTNPIITTFNDKKYNLNKDNNDNLIMNISTLPLINKENSEYFNSIYAKFSLKYTDNHNRKFYRGTYSIKMLLYILNEKGEEETKVFYFQSVKIIGNPYDNLSMPQDVMFEAQSLINLQKIEFYFETDKEFYQDEQIYPQNATISIESIEIQLGHKYSGQTGLKLFTFDTTDYGNIKSGVEKNLRYIWYNKDQNDNFVGLSSLSPSKLHIPENLEEWALIENMQKCLNDDIKDEFPKDKVGLQLQVMWREAQMPIQQLINKYSELELALQNLSQNFKTIYDYSDYGGANAATKQMLYWLRRLDTDMVAIWNESWKSALSWVEDKAYTYDEKTKKPDQDWKFLDVYSSQQGTKGYKSSPSPKLYAPRIDRTTGGGQYFKFVVKDGNWPDDRRFNLYEMTDDEFEQEIPCDFYLYNGYNVKQSNDTFLIKANSNEQPVPIRTTDYKGENITLYPGSILYNFWSNTKDSNPQSEDGQLVLNAIGTSETLDEERFKQQLSSWSYMYALKFFLIEQQRKIDGEEKSKYYTDDNGNYIPERWDKKWETKETIRGRKEWKNASYAPRHMRELIYLHNKRVAGYYEIEEDFKKIVSDISSNQQSILKTNINNLEIYQEWVEKTLKWCWKKQNNKTDELAPDDTNIVPNVESIITINHVSLKTLFVKIKELAELLNNTLSKIYNESFDSALWEFYQIYILPISTLLDKIEELRTMLFDKEYLSYKTYNNYISLLKTYRSDTESGKVFDIWKKDTIQKDSFFICLLQKVTGANNPITNEENWMLLTTLSGTSKEELEDLIQKSLLPTQLTLQDTYYPTLTKNIKVNLKNSGSQQSTAFKLVLVQDEKPNIESNELIFNNIINLNLFSITPHIHLKQSTDFRTAALTSPGTNKTIKLDLQCYADSTELKPITCYDYNTDPRTPGLELIITNVFGLSNSKCCNNVLDLSFRKTSKDEIVGININIQDQYKEKKLPKTPLFFSLKLHLNDGSEEEGFVAVPIASSPILHCSGTKILIFDDDGTVYQDSENPYTLTLAKLTEDEILTTTSVSIRANNRSTLEEDNVILPDLLEIKDDFSLSILNTAYENFYDYLYTIIIKAKDKAGNEYWYKQPLLYFNKARYKMGWENTNIINAFQSIADDNTNPDLALIDYEKTYFSLGISDIQNAVQEEEKKESPNNKVNIATVGMESNTYTNLRRNREINVDEDDNENLETLGKAFLSPNYPYFQLINKHNDKNIIIDPKLKEPIQLFDEEKGISFALDGTIKFSKTNFEPILINYDTLTDGTLGIQIQQIGVIQDDEIISTCN